MDLTYQTPARGISLEQEFNTSKMYRISCDCGDDNHAVILDIEAEDIGIAVRHYVTVDTSWWDNPTPFFWVNSILHRIKVTWEVWTRGHIRMEVATLLNEQLALNYAETIKKAIEDVKESRKNLRNMGR